MHVTHEYWRIERGVIPPRCRKPRDVWYEEELTVEVSEVSAADAPVGFRVELVFVGWAELRWWNGRLWRRHLPHAHQTEDTVAGSPRFPEHRRREAYILYNSTEAAAADLKEWAGRFLIIDGVVYEKTSEPTYSIATFGLGFNHGGTALMVGAGLDSRYPVHRQFTANQFDDARTAATVVALDRGDTESAESFKTMKPMIEVLLPDAQTLVIPGTYTVTVQYTERVTFDVTAFDEDEARADAARRIASGDMNRVDVDIAQDPASIVVLEAVRQGRPPSRKGADA